MVPTMILPRFLAIASYTAIVSYTHVCLHARSRLSLSRTGRTCVGSWSVRSERMSCEILSPEPGPIAPLSAAQ